VRQDEPQQLAEIPLGGERDADRTELGQLARALHRGVACTAHGGQRRRVAKCATKRGELRSVGRAAGMKLVSDVDGELVARLGVVGIADADDGDETGERAKLGAAASPALAMRVRSSASTVGRSRSRARGIGSVGIARNSHRHRGGRAAPPRARSRVR
jgi:hypothetical protein